MFYRTSFIFVGVVFSINCFAQQGFRLSPDDIPPSELKYGEKFNELRSSSQNKDIQLQISLAQSKTDTHYDLKHYFNEHDWIVISLGFYDYFGKNKYYDYNFEYPIEKVKKYANEILNSLPEASYVVRYSSEMYPNLGLIIREEALESIYRNKRITTLNMPRVASN